jgi:hypothetical protein
MKKYWVVKNLETNLYLAPVTHLFNRDIMTAATFDTEDSAVNWVSHIKGPLRVEIFAIYVKY